jgi:RNA polymerase sigma-70 factor (ECF subfamily)
VIDDDRALVGRVVAGRDHSAFGALYDRHGTYLYRLALRLLGGDEAAAEDAAHDAWVRAYVRLPDFQWRSELRTWLAGFVVNAARERQRAVATLDLDDSIAADDSALTGLYDRLDLTKALAALPSGFREVLILHDAEGYTHDDIAALLGIATGTSKSQLSRARAAMRRLLRESTPLRT